MKQIKLLLLVFCMVISSCSIQRAATTMTAGVVTNGLSALESESDLWIAKESILPLVKVLEVFHDGDPKNPKFSGLMARVYGNVTFGFFEPRYLETKDADRALWRTRIERYYRTGYESGMIALRDRFGKGIDGSVVDFEKAIGKANKKDLMTLFWTAFDLGNLVNLNRDDVASIVNLPKVQAMVDKVLEIDPDFAYGAALSFKAAMLGSRPKMLAGDPEKAAQLFDEATKKFEGKYLMNKVMYAEWYAIPQGDSKLAKQLLNDVVNSATPAIKGQELANELAKERARILLNNSSLR